MEKHIIAPTYSSKKRSKAQSFQYKLLRIIKVILRSGKSDSPLCSFCKKSKKNKVSLFYSKKWNIYGTNSGNVQQIKQKFLPLHHRVLYYTSWVFHMIIYYLTFSSLPSNFIYSLPETNSLDTEYLKAITEWKWKYWERN